MSRIQIKFGKIDRCEPASMGGTGCMDILARRGSEAWASVGSAEVLSDRVGGWQAGSGSPCAVSSVVAYLDDGREIEVGAYFAGRSAAEAKRILKAKIIEELSN